MTRLRALPWGLIALCVGSIAALIAITPVDYDRTVYLINHRTDPAVTILRRTLFEGDWPGGSDPPIIAGLVLIGSYLWVTSSRTPTALSRTRPALGFLLVSTLAAALGVVHTLKWILGRARPYSVVAGEHLPFTSWYTTGPHFVTEGIYRGSFPSGHTAAVFMFIAVAYVLAGDPHLPGRWRLAGWGVGALTLAYSAVMVVASAMARSHWLSDAIGVVGLVWIVVHLLYYWVLCVPDQRRYWRTHGGPPNLSRRWELILCGWGFLVLLGVVAAGLGIRALWLQPTPYLSALVPVGVGMIAFGLPKMRAILRHLHHAVARPARVRSAS